MSDRSDRLKAGLFVVTCVTLFAIIVIVVAGMRLAKRTKTYYVRFAESVTGLEPSSTVRYYGVPIGRVSHIGFAAESFPEIEATIEVEPGTPIRADTEAVLKAQGLTGISYIDLESGSPKSRLLEEYETIRARESVTVQLMDTLQGIKDVVENLNGLLAENREGIGAAVAKVREVAEAAQGPIARLDEVIDGVNGLTKDLRERVAETSASAREALAAVVEVARAPELRDLPVRVAGVLDRADAVLKEVEGKVKGADVEPVLTKLSAALAAFEEASQRLDSAVADVHAGLTENRGAFARILGDVRVFSADLRALARELRADPSRLVIPRRTPEREEGR